MNICKKSVSILLSVPCYVMPEMFHTLFNMFFKNNNNSVCISPAIKWAFSINIILREITPYNWQAIIFSKIQNLRYWNASGHVFQSIKFFSTRMISLHNSDFCELTNYLFMGMKKVIFQLPYYHPLLSWMNFFSVFFVQMISTSLCVCLM